MAIVYKNNIYYLPTVLLEGENGRVYYQITKGNNYNVISAGMGLQPRYFF